MLILDIEKKHFSATPCSTVNLQCWSRIYRLESSESVDEVAKSPHERPMKIWHEKLWLICPLKVQESRKTNHKLLKEVLNLAVNVK